MKANKLVRILCLSLIMLCWSITSWADQPVKLRLLYFNDFHGFADPSKSSANPDQWGGIAYLAAEVNRLREECPTLLLAAGDMIQGHPWANLFEGRSTIEVLNAMQVSAMVLGNHEFDFGQEALKKRSEEARFPILAANVKGLKGIRPYMITEAGGLRIAVIGVVTENTPTATHPKNVKGLSFTSPITAVREVLRGLAPKPDLLIILSHLGFPADQRLAKAVPGIQVIVGGHTHTRIETPVQADETLIVQAWEHGKVLGLLDLTVRNGKVLDYEGRLIPIQQESIKPDPRITKIVENYNLKAKTILEEVIGEALVDLQAQGSRMQETNLGNFVADILREETKADAALINGGGLRDDILKGPIRGRDLLSVLPFRNFPLSFKVKGHELKAILEHGFSNLSGGAGGYPQVSGMRVTYNPTAPVGERVNGLWVKDKPVEPEAWYTLATYDFLASGGDGYSIIADLISLKDGYPVKNPRLVFFESGRDIREITEAYIRTKKKVSAQIEGRIRISQ